MSQRVIKTVCDRDGEVDMRRFRVPHDVNLEDLTELVASSYLLNENVVRLNYVDDEEDLLTIASDDSLKEAFSFYDEQKKAVKLFVVVVADDKNDHTVNSTDVTSLSDDEWQDLTESASAHERDIDAILNTTLSDVIKEQENEVKEIEQELVEEVVEATEAKVDEAQDEGETEVAVPSQFEIGDETVTIEDITEEEMKGSYDEGIESVELATHEIKPEAKPECQGVAEADKPEDDLPMPDKQVIQQLIHSFLTDKEVEAVLPKAMDDVTQRVIDKCKAAEIVDYVVTEYPQIGSHGLVLTMLPHFDKVEAKLDAFIAGMRPELANMLKMVISCHFKSDPSAIGPILLTLLNQGDADISLGTFNVPPGGFPCVDLPCMSAPTDVPTDVSDITIGVENCCDVEEDEECLVPARYVCDDCNGVISGTRYRCMECPNFDLCEPCEEKDEHPAAHTLMKIKPGVKGKTIHQYITCDNCMVTPIVGARYKCTVCFDYDLCEKCEGQEGVHAENHPLLKMKVEQGAVAKSHGRGPACGRGRGRGMRGLRGIGRAFRSMFGAKLGGGGRGRGMGGKRCGGGKGVNHVNLSNDSNPSPDVAFPSSMSANANPVNVGVEKTPEKEVEVPKQAPIPLCKDTYLNQPQAKFGRDLTCPDRSEFPAGDYIVKTWELMNSGIVDWPEGSKLVFIRGSRELSSAEEFEVQPAKAGERVEISALLQAPSKPGRYVTYFRLADGDRNLFGPRIWADVIVTEPVPAAPAAVQNPEEVRLKSQLEHLRSLGFGNDSLNRYLLEKNNNNLTTVVEWFLKNQK